MVELSSKPVEVPVKLPRFIYITGCDGTGKSTQASLLHTQLQAAGVNTQLVWLRFPFFFCLPLLAYARWRKLSWYEESLDARHGYWDFRKSWLLKTFLPWLLFLDAFLAAIPRIYVPILRGKTVICERFVLDMLIDMGIAFGKGRLYQRLPGKFFLKLLPANASIFILDLDANTVRQRRENLKADRRLDDRLQAFRELAADLSIRTFSSALPVEKVNHLITRAVYPNGSLQEK